MLSPCRPALLVAALALGVVTPACVGAFDGAETPSAGDPASPAAGAAGNGPGGAGAPVPGAVGPAVSCTPDGIAPLSRWRRLTALQYRNTVRDLLGLDADTSQFLHDTRTGPFDTNAGLAPQDADIDRYRDAAEALATQAVADPARLTRCDAKATGEDACAARFITDFGARAYRRPLAPEENERLLALYKLGKPDGYTTGLRLVVEALLQAPSFLYVTEFGSVASKGVALTGHELASRLSYLLWNTMPDAELFSAAKDGRLDSVDGIRAQAQRLLASERFLETAAAFHTQLFAASRLTHEGEVSKAGFPEFDATMRAAMLDEVRRYVRHVMTSAGGTVGALFSTTSVFPTGPLVKLYGAGTPGADGRLAVTNGSRVGVLTLAAVLASEPALATPYAAVHRGRMVRTNLLCQEIPPPNVMVEFKAPPNADKLSEQELARVHQENPTCAPCHQLMDSIGFAFSAYDAIGRYRTTAPSGGRFDTTGEIAGVTDGLFDGPAALSTKLGRIPEVRSCLARQWFRFALGRDAEGADACAVRAVGDALARGAGDLREALLTLVTTDPSRQRRGN